MNIIKILINKFIKSKPIKKRSLTDLEFNTLRKEKQDKIDQILDKVSKVGYNNLTKSEKDFLKKSN